jgi:serine-type D-Ala-D-Ala carboxypeptidase/endopeptidase
MNTRGCIFCICFMLLISSVTALPTPNEWKISANNNFTSLSKEEVDAFISPLITYNVSKGIVVGLVDKGGYTWYSYGQPEIKTGKPLDNTTLFDIGSVSKVMTGLLMADAEIRGDYNLSVPVNSWLTDQNFLPDDEGIEITGIDLVTHRSGLPRIPDTFTQVDPSGSEADQVEESMQNFHSMSADETYRWVAASSLLTPPGYQYLYSNLGGAIAGDIVARAEGISFSQLLTEKITGPLEMTSTGATWNRTDLDRRASGYRAYAYPTDDAHLIRFNEFWTATGGIHSDADDMAVFLAAQMNLIDTPLTDAILMTHVPLAVSNTGPPLLEQGIFWDIFHNRDGTILLKKSGETNSHQAEIAYNPAMKTGVIIFSNTAYVGGIHIEDTALAFLERMYVKEVNLKKGYSS